MLINLTRRTYTAAPRRLLRRSTAILAFFIALDDEVDSVAAFEVDDGHVAAIWIIRNPDKLTHVGSPSALT